jgi:PBP1b-binding outer membrane lipoprotein LpoB
MKKLIVFLGIIFVLTGCSKQTKVETPPWSKQQVKQMEEEKVESVPLIKFKF